MINNNTWVEANDSSTVVVFVHGILSSSETCWRNPKNGAYWPDLVLNDKEFGRPSVFVAGYAADILAGEYEVRDVAEELVVRLRSQIAGNPPVIAKEKILFVCHSQGGIVVRQMLVSHPNEFARKKIGVVLCASPGWGSKWASFLSPLASLIGFRQVQGLRWGNSVLTGLDRDFLALKERREIAELCGLSLIETRGSWGLPKFVSTPAAARYFEQWKTIPKANHGQVVKPDSTNQLSHVYLLDFAKRNGFISVSSTRPIWNGGDSAIPPKIERLRQLAFEPADRQRFIRSFSRGPHVPMENVAAALITEVANIFPTIPGNPWPEVLKIAAEYRTHALEADEKPDNAVLVPARVPKGVPDTSLWHSAFQVTCLIGPRMLASLCLALIHQGYARISPEALQATLQLVDWLEQNRQSPNDRT